MPDRHDSVRRSLRWWPAGVVMALAIGGAVWIQSKSEWSFQERNLKTLGLFLVTGLVLLLWWLFASRAPWRMRLAVAVGVALAIGLVSTVFRIRGVSGDLLPILEPRWARHVVNTPSAPVGDPSTPTSVSSTSDFPQFLGPDRTGMLQAPTLNRDWAANPPKILWRQPVGAAWSGWAVVGARALTQEQLGEKECCTC